MTALSHLLDDNALDGLRGSGSNFVHIIAVATKPDIIKQAPIYHELVRRGENVIVCHSEQHRDHAYSGAMLEEFGMPVHVGLGLTDAGGLSTKAAQMIQRFGELVIQLKAAGLMPVPYIHGDTATSMAVGVGSYLNQVACVHVEAGIRTLTPKREVYDHFLERHRNGTFDFDEYAKALRDPSNFEKGSREPFPEQFNTRVSDAATGYHAAPVELVRGFLLDEGFPADTIEVVGNTVVDATRAAQRDAAQATIFETYPQLRTHRFIRICIHRRENTESKERFTVLFDAVEELVRRGNPVLFIRLFGTEAALDKHGLRGRLDALQREFPETFISSPVWPYYRDVIAAMLECGLVATDSGSMQEEVNVLGIPCVTLRFGTDRAESVLAGGNVLAPPLNAGFVVEIVEAALKRPELGDADNIYGEGVAATVVTGVLQRVDESNGLFRAEESRIWLSSRR